MSSEKNPVRLRWKREEPARGLASVGAGPRSSWLHDGEKRYACVSALGRGINAPWYWVSGWDSGVPRENTYDRPVATEAEAKRQALDHVKEYLSMEQS